MTVPPVNTLPAKASCVRLRGASEAAPYGHVLLSFVEDSVAKAKIHWFHTNKTTIEPLVKLCAAFRVGMDVQDVPASRGRNSLGEGVVLRTRTLGGRDQVLVDFPVAGRQVWLPAENVAQIKSTKHRFIVGDSGGDQNAELFRLKTLAHALEMWNENTGSLSSLEIDPLPHQIHLVHHILASGTLNWLIADDVGLGKTIETGMLLAALKQRGRLNRVLLVTPAGLTRQWQEELNEKFNMGEFQIFGEDFRVNESRHWKMYDYVIASMDRLKDPEQIASLSEAGAWDLIVFDEAHRLSRRQYGMKLDASQRFQLAASLRSSTEAMLLLSATPHQGMHDKFQALLELLRPERKDEISTLVINPEIIGEMVYRNNKADVTDVDGEFIFHGKTTVALQVRVSEEALAFDRRLQAYLKQGYAAGAKLGVRGNAIGFVMTVYRKLAASSVAAIHQALVRRLGRLKNDILSGEALADQEVDARFQSEVDEELRTERTEFFRGEIKMLGELVDEIEYLRDRDRKLGEFIDVIVKQVHSANPDEKILIFTEYRTTQDYLRNALEDKFGLGCASVINGSMKHDLRRDAIRLFEADGRFLISTEAGGEGINLQKKCHVIINYDLPWNPMRLVQRIGRLYRYGQKERVVVFNIHSPDTADEKILHMMYSRIDQVVDDLAGVSAEYNDRMRDDIVGEVAELVDVGTILAEASTKGIARTEERIEEALSKAKEAAEMQIELFDYAAGFNPDELANNLRIDADHGMSFVRGMLEILAIEIVEVTHSSRLLHIRLPETIQKMSGATRSRYEITLDRALAASRPGTHMLDFDSFLMRYLIATAKSYEFGGLTSAVRSKHLVGQAVMANLLRWQDGQGNRMRQEYAALQVLEDGSVIVNPDNFSKWLKEPAVTGDLVATRDENRQYFSAVELAADERLNFISNEYLHPENSQWIGGAWLV